MRYRHTWNVVTVEGQRYHVDATFDNSLQRGMKRYDYFNLDDRHIFRDHQRLVLPLPGVQRRQGVLLPVAVLHQDGGCGEAGAAGPRKKQEHFVFHWRGGGLNQEILGSAGEVRRCGGGGGARPWAAP